MKRIESEASPERPRAAGIAISPRSMTGGAATKQTHFIERIMDENRKRAYRYVLYRAMLDIRILQWQVYSPLKLLNPIHALNVIKFTRRAGALADLLHNLALFSALDFDHFKEDYFWEEHDRFSRQYGGGDDFFNCRSVFNSELERQVKESSTIK